MDSIAPPIAPSDHALPDSLARTLSSDDRRRGGAWTLAEAFDYCRRLATSHYENFHVGTWLFPKDARPHAYSFYAYCRWSDDLADETGDPAASLALLSWWRERLDRAFDGRPDHVVMVALSETIKAYRLSKEPFTDLIDAFEQDQRVFRYATFDELLDYCRRSANPVGRVVLSLLGHDDERRRALSDKTCTALQLANHWQDIENDLRRGRIYLPKEDMDAFHVNEEDLAMPTASEDVRKLVAFECDRARSLFEEGLDLVKLVHGRARFDIDLFSRGGLAILDAIAAQGYDVLARRPVVGKFKKFRLLAGSLVRGLLGHRRTTS